MDLQSINRGKAILKAYGDHDHLHVREDGLYCGCNVQPSDMMASDVRELEGLGFTFDTHWASWKVV